MSQKLCTIYFQTPDGEIVTGKCEEIVYDHIIEQGEKLKKMSLTIKEIIRFYPSDIPL